MGEARAPLAEPLDDVPRDAEGRVDLVRLASALAPPRTAGAPLLESAPGVAGTGRWSYVIVGTPGGTTGPPDPFGTLAQRCSYLGLDPHASRDHSLPPLTGGLVGTWSYDLARHVERLPEHAVRDRDVPVIDVVEADLLVTVDHEAIVHRARHAPPSSEPVRPPPQRAVTSLQR